jgi:hypothetical protein
MSAGDLDDDYLKAHARYAEMREQPGLAESDLGVRAATRYDDVAFALKNVDIFGGTLGYDPSMPEEEQILPPSPSRATARCGGSSTGSSPRTGSARWSPSSGT